MLCKVSSLVPISDHHFNNTPIETFTSPWTRLYMFLTQLIYTPNRWMVGDVCDRASSFPLQRCCCPASKVIYGSAICSWTMGSFIVFLSIFAINMYVSELSVKLLLALIPVTLELRFMTHWLVFLSLFSRPFQILLYLVYSISPF